MRAKQSMPNASSDSGLAASRGAGIPSGAAAGVTVAIPPLPSTTATLANPATTAAEPANPANASARRIYEPPRILFREPLEAMAAICSPHPPAKQNKGLCPMGPISS